MGAGGGYRGPDGSWWEKAAKQPVPVHARATPGRLALCGNADQTSKSTTRRSEVTCARCLVEIERRLEARRSRR